MAQGITPQPILKSNFNKHKLEEIPIYAWSLSIYTSIANIQADCPFDKGSNISKKLSPFIFTKCDWYIHKRTSVMS